MITVRSFTADYLASLTHVDEDRELLSHHFGIPLDCVRKTTSEEDKTTLVDYVATLPDGQETTVDMKRRTLGASQYWKHQDTPEFAVELWSGGRYGHTGPLFSNESLADYYCLVFDDVPNEYWMLPTGPLRAAAEAHIDEWTSEYKTAESRTLNQDGTHSTTLVCYVPLPRLVADLTIKAGG